MNLTVKDENGTRETVSAGEMPVAWHSIRWKVIIKGKLLYVTGQTQCLMATWLVRNLFSRDLDKRSVQGVDKE